MENKISIHLTFNAAKTLAKELKTNSIPYKHIGSSRILVNDGPKTQMAIRMTCEKHGLQCLIIRTDYKNKSYESVSSI